MMQNRSQEQLLYWIDMVSMMLVDLTEYLDTHPFDEAAMVILTITSLSIKRP